MIRMLARMMLVQVNKKDVLILEWFGAFEPQKVVKRL